MNPERIPSPVRPVARSGASRRAGLPERPSSGPEAGWEGAGSLDFNRARTSATAIGSLWDLGLLDGLRAPLTRYHE